MKKIFSILILAACCLTVAAEQPVVILYPSIAWMKMHKYGKSEQLPNGRTKFNPDYNMAFENGLTDQTEITTALSTTSATLTGLNLKCENLQQRLESLGDDAAIFDELGAELGFEDELNQTVKADIQVDVEWGVVPGSQIGPRKKYFIKLTAKDVYCGDAIASIDTQTDLSAEGLQSAMKRAIDNNAMEFVSKIEESFDKTLKYGKEVKVLLATKGGLSFNKDMVQGQVMKYYFRDALKSLANEGMSDQKRDSERMQEYRMRVPLSVKIEDLGELLQNKLAAAGVTITVKKVGLGQFAVVIGD